MRELVNPGSGCVFCRKLWKSRWKITAEASRPRTQNEALVSLPCGNERRCWVEWLKSCRPCKMTSKKERWFAYEFLERSLIPMADKISVLLVDDHTLVRRGFRRILEDETDIKVVGEAGDGSEAVKLTEELRPKVIVMDCAMPGMNGLEATRQILDKHPQALVLMLSMHPEETLVRQELHAGARGYVLKNAVDLRLGAAIRRVVKGEIVLDSQLKRPAALKGKRSTGLTPRELEVLQMIVDGKSNKEIASALELSANTVAVHRANMMDTLGIHKAAELVVYAIRNGLVDLP